MPEVLIIIFTCIVNCSTITMSSSIYDIKTLDECNRRLPAIVREYDDLDPSPLSYNGKCTIDDILKPIPKIKAV